MVQPLTTIRFMAGLPRSGTSMLASILNRDKRIYLTPQSELVQYLTAIDQHHSESHELGVLLDNPRSLLCQAPYAFHSTVNADVVIDKSRKWGAPYYLRLLTQILEEPPLILSPVRPLVEVVSSLVRKAQENPQTNYIDKSMKREDFLPYYRKTLDDARVDWILSPKGAVQVGMLSVAAALNEETASMFHVYSYSDLVNEPKKTIDGIYDFLGIDRFTHDFEKIQVGEPHNDMQALGIPDMHTVRPILSDTSPRPEEVLSDYGLTRCAIEDFWTDRIKA